MKLRKFLSMMLVTVMTVCLMNGLQFNMLTAKAEVLTGYCGSTQDGGDGTNLQWSLNTETGALVISGSGAMGCYGYSDMCAYEQRAPWSNQKQYIQSVNISEGVTSIGSCAFCDCVNMTEINIPETVTTIYQYAFYGCSGLTEINLPESITEIYLRAFERCTGLTEVDIPGGMTVIEEGVFVDCISLTDVNISESVTGISFFAFGGCSSLTEIILPESVEGLASAIFDGCSSLNDVYILNENCSFLQDESSSSSDVFPDGVTLHGYAGSTAQQHAENYNLTFAEINPNEEPTTQEIVTGSCGTNLQWSLNKTTGVLTITGSGAMEDYSTSVYAPWYNDRNSITSVVLPGGLTNIGNLAFYNCTHLAGSPTIPDTVTSIGTYAFYKCSGLTGSLTIPGSVTTINSCAFGGCRNLTGTLEIPNGVTTIASSSFQNCSGFTALTIPGSVTSISSNAFNSCSGLASISVNSGNTVYNSNNNCNAIIQTSNNKLIRGCKNTVIPDTVTSIGSSAFYGCSDLTEIDIPQGVTAIGSSAFNYCGSLNDIYIYNRACTINDSENTIYSGAKIHGYAGSTAESYAEKYSRTFVLMVDGYCGLTENGADGTNLAWSLNKTTGVLTITGSGAMENYTSSVHAPWYDDKSLITSVVLPNGLTSIGDFAFYNCNKMVGELTIPGTVASIGTRAFSGCSRLTGNLMIPGGVTAIGANAFYQCSGLTGTLVIPNGITSIASATFQNCTGFTGLTIPESVTSISANAFSLCSSLTTITVDSGNTVYNSNDNCNAIIKTSTKALVKGCKNTVIPDNIKSIGSYAFAGCNDMTEINIPAAVTSIGSYALYGCNDLTEINIPATVTTIGSNAFNNCSSLNDIYIYNRECAINDSSATIYSGTTIHGYANSTAQTYADTYSRTFVEIEEWTEVPGGNDSPNHVTQGIWDLWDKDSSGNTNYDGAMSYKGSGETLQDLTLRIDEPVVFNPSYNLNNNILGMKTRIPLENLKKYQYTVKFTSTKAGSASICWGLDNRYRRVYPPGCDNEYYDSNNPVIDVRVAKGENILTGIIWLTCDMSSVMGSHDYVDFSFLPSDGTTALPAGTEINFTEISFKDYVELDDEDFQGKCGDNVYWSLNRTTGVLSITGRGQMYSYRECSAPWYYLNSDIQTVNIAKGITNIGSYAFHDGHYITEINIPDSVTTIGDSAFYGCRNLSEISIPKKLKTIGSNAFYCCRSLSEIEIPANITSIGYNAFACQYDTYNYYHHDIDYVDPDEYGSYHRPRSNLTDIYIYSDNCNIDNSSDTIYSGAKIHGFVGSTAQTYATNKNRTFVEIATSGQCGENVNWSFNRNSGTLVVTGYGPMYSYESADEIPWYRVRELIEIVWIYEDITTIGDRAFEDCSNLVDVYMPGDYLTTIGYHAFYGCSDLEYIIIPESVKTIGTSAFCSCTSLTEIAIPESVTSMGNSVFFGCSSLTDVTIPEGITNIGTKTFAYCSALTEVRIPDSLTRIGEWTFFNCGNLTDINIPKNVTAIDARAFDNCNSLTAIYIYNENCSITDAENTIIESATIYGYTNSTAQAYATKYNRAFVDINGWAAVPGGNGSPNHVIRGVWDLWDKNSSGSTNYNGAMSCRGNGETLQALTMRIDEPVVFNPSYNLSGYLNSTSYNLDSDILGMKTRIPLQNLKKYQYTVKFTSTKAGNASICWGLDNRYKTGYIKLPGGDDYDEYYTSNNPVMDVQVAKGENVLTGIIWLTYDVPSYFPSHNYVDFCFFPSDGTGVLPAGTEINFTEISFKNYEGLNDEDFQGKCGDNVYWSFNRGTHQLNITGSGLMYSYRECSAPWYYLSGDIRKVNIAEGITNIGNCAFYDGHYITDVNIPDSVTAIGDGAFYGCRNLEEITIPENVSSIGANAFYSCKLLKEISLPVSVTSIGYNAFDCYHDAYNYYFHYYYCSPDDDDSGPYDSHETPVLGDIYIYNDNCNINNSAYTIYSKAVIHGYANSTAQTYATTYDRSFVPLEEPTTEEPEEDPNFVIAKKQLALTNGLRFYFKADKKLFTESGYTDPTMVIEFNNGETVVEEYVEEAQYYAFPFNDIAPHQMGMNFSATLHAYKNGVEYVSPALEYSVSQYCYDVFDAYKQYSYNQYAKLYTLLVDLLNYGAQAQLYTNTDTDNLVNANLTAEQQSHATTLSGEFVNSRNYNYESISNPSVTWQAAALNLRDSIVMRLRFAAKSTDGLVVKARDDKGNEWEIDAEAFESAGSGTYNVYFDQFNVGRMSDIVYLTVYNGNTPVSNTCSFSIESYAAVIQQNAGTYADLNALTIAMMKYGKAAKTYTS